MKADCMLTPFALRLPIPSIPLGASIVLAALQLPWSGGDWPGHAAKPSSPELHVRASTATVAADGPRTRRH
jgi:hypothetical protein